jgi:hypothetical protein
VTVARLAVAQRRSGAAAAELTIHAWSSLFRENEGCQTLRHTTCWLRHGKPVPRAAIVGTLCQNRPDDPMKTIDEMLSLELLTPDQHHQISAWIAQADSPEEILKMPAPLWKAVERASAVMGVDEDLMRPPSLDADDTADR